MVGTDEVTPRGKNTMRSMGGWVWGGKGRQGDSSKFAAELEFNLLGDAVEIAEAAHEGVPKAM